MKTRHHLKIMLFLIVLGLMNCVSTKDTLSGNTSTLEGSWENNTFKLVVKGNYYISLYNDVLYGRGTITYDGNFFTLASTHAWQNNNWVEIVETVNGRCIVKGNSVIITDVQGRYNVFNGEWKKIDNIDFEEYIKNPPAQVRGTSAI